MAAAARRQTSSGFLQPGADSDARTQHPLAIFRARRVAYHPARYNLSFRPVQRIAHCWSDLAPDAYEYLAP